MKAELASSDVMDIERFVPALLNHIANRLSSTGSKTYRQRCNIGIMDFRILAMLAVESEISGARIAEVIDLNKAAVSKTLQSLRERGLVKIAPGFGRIKTAALTAAGRRVHARAFMIAQERERVLLERLTPAEREKLIELLGRLLAATPNLRNL